MNFFFFSPYSSKFRFLSKFKDKYFLFSNPISYRREKLKKETVCGSIEGVIGGTTEKAFSFDMVSVFIKASAIEWKEWQNFLPKIDNIFLINFTQF